METISTAYNAWKKGMLALYILGEDGSDHSSPSILNVPTPVNWVALVRSIWDMYEKLDKEEKKRFVPDFEKALVNLIKGSDYEIWAVAYVLAMQVSHQEGKNRDVPFIIDLRVVKLFWNTVKGKQLELTQYYPLGRRDLSAYDDIMRLDSILLEDDGASYSSISNNNE